MDKEYAMKMAKEDGVIALIISLYSDGEEDLAETLLESCWGYSDDEVCDFIEDNWNF